MEPFAASLLISQNDDQNIIITDDSNYTTNTDGITAVEVLTRTVVVKDSLGNTVSTIPLTLQTDGSYSGMLGVDADYYYQYLFTITLPGSVTKTSETNYVSIGYYETAFLSVMTSNLSDCGCSSGSICSDLSWAQHLKAAAILFAKKGFGVLSQQAIDGANQFINDILNG